MCDQHESDHFWWISRSQPKTTCPMPESIAGRRITRPWRWGRRRVIWIPLPSLSRPAPSFLGRNTPKGRRVAAWRCPGNKSPWYVGLPGKVMADIAMENGHRTSGFPLNNGGLLYLFWHNQRVTQKAPSYRHEGCGSAAKFGAFIGWFIEGKIRKLRTIE